MGVKTIVVFGASGRQGLAQVKAALDEGYWVRGVTRDPERFPDRQPDGLALVKADYKDHGSVARACRNADAVFLTPPSFTDAADNAAHMIAIAEIAKSAGVQRLVLNTSMFVPDDPIGEPIYDGRLALENAIDAVGPPLTVFRPVLFMDNLLTDWVRPALHAEDMFVYPHNRQMAANWICLEDVAAFMVKALADDSLIGERIVIGGPETLQPENVAEILSGVFGRPIAFRQSSPREFAELLNGIFHDVIGVPDEAQIGALEAFYTYNNQSNLRPMVVDMEPVLKRIPVALTPLKEWASRQNWTPRDTATASPIGG